MSKEKACRQCRRILDAEDQQKQNCPNCGGNQFTTFWRGFVVVIDPEKSEIARKIGVENPGKYALRLSR